MEAGTRVGSYEIVGLLGEGGFAEVYRVRHLTLGSDHALKVLRSDLLEMEDVRQRFLGEARVQAQLRHPNIVQVTDLIAQPGVAGFVMEFVQGESLADAIDGRRSAGAMPSASEIREIFLPVLDAVGYAHAAGVVHRDIKPDNILLARDHLGRLVPKVADFGIAKVVGELKGKRKTTMGARTMGTVGYMSPEQLVSSRDVDGRADIFSIGVALLEFASLESTFERDSDFMTMKAVHEADYTIPDALRAGDAALVAAVERALQVEREDRYADCAAMAVALARCDESAPSTRPPSAPTRPQAKPIPVPAVAPGPRRVPPIVVTQRMGFQRWISVHDGRALIGSGPNDDIVLDAADATAGHARLRKSGGAWLLDAVGPKVTVDGQSVPVGGSRVLATGLRRIVINRRDIDVSVLAPDDPVPEPTPRPKAEALRTEPIATPAGARGSSPSGVQFVSRVDTKGQERGSNSNPGARSGLAYFGALLGAVAGLIAGGPLVGVIGGGVGAAAGFWVREAPGRTLAYVVVASVVYGVVAVSC